MSQTKTIRKLTQLSKTFMFTPKANSKQKCVKRHKNAKIEVLTARKRRHNKAVTHEGCLAALRRWQAAPRRGQAVASDLRCSSVQSWFFPGFTVSSVKT